jgi:DNA modification methylase
VAQIDITRTELVWPGKYDEHGQRVAPPRVTLPFQTIETINEARATREVRKRPAQRTLFDVWSGEEGETFDHGWRNKLIWGDNLLVMSSLLEKFAGKVDLIYIDPPFATGTDFSFTAEVGDGELGIDKQASILEEKAYRDTWARGLWSYLEMLQPRLVAARELLSDKGTMWVHLGPQVSHHVKLMLDDVFGSDSHRGEVTWQRTSAHGDARFFGHVTDQILGYAKVPDSAVWNQVFLPFSETYLDREYRYKDDDGRRFRRGDLTGAGIRRGETGRPWRGIDPTSISRHWIRRPSELDELDKAGRLYWPAAGKWPHLKVYLDEGRGVPISNVWTDIPPVNNVAREGTGYATQKPEALLDRIIRSSSNPGDLVADFFVGSGTTAAVAEKLGRRWIACDLGRFAIHTTRKRLMAIEDCKPFEILNLGKYERQYWQASSFAGRDAQQVLFEYIAFMLRLYGAEPLAGLQHLHGKRSGAVVHVGAVDAPVTIAEVTDALDECVATGQRELHVLGWEWEMGLNDLVKQLGADRGVDLKLRQVPREVMEVQAVEKGDIRFFELAYLDCKLESAAQRATTVELADFAMSDADAIDPEVRAKITKWSDFVDYWAVDFDFQNDTFINGWVAYRTRKDRQLSLRSDSHLYANPGTYNVAVKVVDIFGNDTTRVFPVEVR